MANEDLILSAGFRANLSSIKALRKELENQLSSIGITAAPARNLGALAASVGGNGGGLLDRDVRQKALGLFESRVRSAQEAVAAQAVSAQRGASAVDELRERLSNLTATSGPASAAVVKLKDQLNRAEGQFNKDVTALNNLEGSLKSATSELFTFKSTIQKLESVIGANPIVATRSTSSSLDIPLSRKDKRALQSTFKEFDELKNVIFDVKGNLKVLKSKIGNVKVFDELNPAQQQLANELIDNRKRLKAEGQQQASIDAQNKQAAQERANAQRDLAKAYREAARNQLSFYKAQLQDIQKQQSQSTAEQNRLAEDASKRQVSVINKSAGLAIKKAQDNLKFNETITTREIALSNKLVSIKESIVAAEQKRLIAINRRLVEEKVTTKSGQQATISSVGDLSGISKNLDVANQEKLNRALGEQSNALKSLSANFNSHRGSIGRANALIERYTKNLDAGSKAAFQFGFAARDAASRLVAWSAPASFIFKALELLTSATREIISLDSLTRRLAFFQGDIGGNARNSFEAITEATNVLNDRASVNLKSIIRQSQQTGVSLREVAQGALTVQKIGQDAFVKGNAGTFLETVLSLKRVEGAELDVSRAAEILNATIQQSGASFDETSLFAAKYLDAANKTAFSVDQLAVVVNGILPAFKAIQGAGFDEALSLAEIATKRLGANASRVRTALRQLPTLAVKFSSEIEKSSGVQIVNEDGTIKGSNAILEVLKHVRELKNTAAGFNLADQIAEQENISDVLNLADAVDELEARFKKLDKGIDVVAERNRLEKFFAVSDAQADTLESTLNKLNTSIVALVNNANVSSFLKDFVSGATGVVKTVDSLVSGFKQVSTNLAAALPLVKGFVATFAGRKIAAFGAGFVKGAIGSQLTAEAQEKIGKIASKEGNTISLITAAREEGLISQKQSQSVLTKTLVIEKQLQTTSAVKIGLERQLSAAKLSGVATATQLRTIETQLGVAIEKENALLSRQERLRSGIAVRANQALAGQNKELNLQRKRNQVLTTAAGVASAVAIVAGPKLADAIGGPVGKGVESALITGITAGSAAAIAGPVAALTVGLGAALISGVSTFFNAVDEQAEEQARLSDRNRQINEAITSALETQKKRRDALLAVTDKQDKLEKSRISTESRIEELQIRLNAERQKGVDVSQTEIELAKEIDILDKIRFELNRREKDLLEEKLRFEEKIADVKQKQETASRALNLLEAARTESLKLLGANDIVLNNVKLRFDQQQINSQIKGVQDKIAELQGRLVVLRTRPQREVANEVKQIEGELKKSELELLQLRQEGLQKEFDNRKAILEAASREANKQIDAWKDASNSIRNAFKDTFDLLIENSTRAADALKNKADEIDWSKFGREIGNELDFQTKKTFANVNLARENVRGATRIADANSPNGILGKALGAIEDSFPTDINDVFEDTKKAVKEFREAFANPNAVVTEELKFRREQAKAQIDAIKERFAQEKQVNASFLQANKDLLDSVKNEINARRELIKSHKELISAESERARSLIERPEDFIKSFREALNIKPIFNNLSSNLEDAVKQLRDRFNTILSRPGGLRIAQAAVRSADFAAQQGKQLSSTFSPEALKDLLPAIIKGDLNIENVLKIIASEQAAIKNNLSSGNEVINASGKLQNAQLVVNAEMAKILQEEKRVAELALANAKNEANKRLGDVKEQTTVLQMLSKDIQEELGQPLANALTTSGYFVGVTSITRELSNIRKVLEGGQADAPVGDFQRDFFEEVIAGVQKNQETLAPLDAIRNSSNVQKTSQDKAIQKIDEIAQKQLESSFAGTEALNALKQVTQNLKISLQENASISKEPIKIEQKIAPLEISPDAARQLIDNIVSAQAVSLDKQVLALKPIADKLEQLISNGISIKGEDILIKVQAKLDQTIDTSEEFTRLLTELSGGDKAQIEILREAVKKLLRKQALQDPANADVFSIDSLDNQSRKQ